MEFIALPSIASFTQLLFASFIKISLKESHIKIEHNQEWKQNELKSDTAKRKSNNNIIEKDLKSKRGIKNVKDDIVDGGTNNN